MKSDDGIIFDDRNEDFMSFCSISAQDITKVE